MMHKTDTKTLASAMRILAIEIESEDGIAKAAIAEAARRRWTNSQQSRWSCSRARDASSFCRLVARGAR
jgi:hypothetical protein